jgi:hypothetical protein
MIPLTLSSGAGSGSGGGGGGGGGGGRVAAAAGGAARTAADGRTADGAGVMAGRRLQSGSSQCPDSTCSLEGQNCFLSPSSIKLGTCLYTTDYSPIVATDVNDTATTTTLPSPFGELVINRRRLRSAGGGDWQEQQQQQQERQQQQRLLQEDGECLLCLEGGAYAVRALACAIDRSINVNESCATARTTHLQPWTAGPSQGADFVTC